MSVFGWAFLSIFLFLKTICVRLRFVLLFCINLFFLINYLSLQQSSLFYSFFIVMDNMTIIVEAHDKKIGMKATSFAQ